MYKGKNIKQLQEMARESSRKLNLELRIFDETMSEAVKGAPEEQKAEIENVKAMCQKAISLAKAGKLDKAQETIKDFQNGRKNNK